MVNKENLKLLSKALKDNFEVVSEQFDMSVFRDFELGHNVGEVMEPHHACGTVGCVVGWMPFLGVPEFKIVKEDFYEESSKLLDHASYSFRLIFNEEYDTLRSNTAATDKDLWGFMFGYSWDRTEYSTLSSAIKRIDLVIEFGHEVLEIEDEQVLEFKNFSVGF